MFSIEFKKYPLKNEHFFLTSVFKMLQILYLKINDDLFDMNELFQYNQILLTTF